MLFAQLTSQVTDSQIRLIIIALLVVALLLALLTVWFAVHTSPRRRRRVAQQNGRPTSRTTRHAEDEEPAGTGTVTASTVTAAQRTPTAEELDDAWINLTGPGGD